MEILKGRLHARSELPAMIRRAFLTQFRVAGASLRSLPKSSLLWPRIQTGNASIVHRLRPVTTTRWYATEPEQGRVAEGEAETPGETLPDSSRADDAVKQELEAKNKEIIDLKVCRLPYISL